MQYLKLVMMYSCCNIDLHSPRIGVHLFLRKLPLLTCAVMILSFLPITSIPDFPASLSAPPSFLDFFLVLVILYSILCPKSHSFSYLHLLSNLHLIIFLFSFRVCASFVILGQFSFHLCLNSHIPSFFQFFPNLHGICALFCFFHHLLIYMGMFLIYRPLICSYFVLFFSDGSFSGLSIASGGPSSIVFTY